MAALKKLVLAIALGLIGVHAARFKTELQKELQIPSPELIAKFRIVNYTWDDTDAPNNGYETYMATEAWRNNSIAGIKYIDGSTFISVPRWWPGVPATLNKLVFQNGKPLMRPWPSWHLQTRDDCACLQYVQSMEVVDGEMWVIDAGSNVIAEGPGPCPPKIIIFNLATRAIVDSYTFPAEVATYNGASFLNDIMVDTVEQVAYISEMFGGVIVVYDRKAQKSRKFEDVSTKPELTPGVVIHGKNYGPAGPAPGAGVNGIALTPNRERIFYCAMQGMTFYSVSTGVLRDMGSTQDQISATVMKHGEKPGVSDGLTFDSRGMLYWGGLSNSSRFQSEGDALWSWTPEDALGSSPKLEAANVHWVDTFAFDDEAEDLLFATNRLDMFFNHRDEMWTEAYNTEEDPNFQIYKMHIGAKSYLASQRRA